MLGRARAEFGVEQPADVVATLDELYQSAEGHLLYARALEAIGRIDEATEEYNARSYFSGAEARVRYSMLLNRLGREAEGKRVLDDLMTHMRQAPKYVRSRARDGAETTAPAPSRRGAEQQRVSLARHQIDGAVTRTNLDDDSYRPRRTPRSGAAPMVGRVARAELETA
jgi:hypothetical protein